MKYSDLNGQNIETGFTNKKKIQNWIDDQLSMV